MDPQLLVAREFLIDKDDISYVRLAVVAPQRFSTIIIYYQFQSRTDFITTPNLLANQTLAQPRFVIRRIFSRVRYDAKKLYIRLVQQARYIRNKLEILYFGRKYLVDIFVNGIKVLSLLLKNFTDSFRLYRNMHRSLIGFYFILASLLFQESNRRSNVICFTLSLYSSNLRAVVAAIAPRLLQLNAGEVIEIPGRSKFLVYTFISYFISDMLQ